LNGVFAFYFTKIKEPNMNTNKIKTALTNALQLLNHEIVSEITQESKDEYLQVINEIVEALREFD
jgi:hypothetical protein